MADMYRSNEAELESNNYNKEESEDDADLDLSCSSSSYEAREDEENENNNTGGAVTPYQFEPYASDDASSSSSEDSNSENSDQGLHDTDWCQCSNCVVMATGIECVCCQEITRVTDMIGELEIEQELKCISEHPGFEPVCLNTYVLQTAYYQYRQQYGLEVEDSNEKYRYTAYRQFVRWIWGYLRKKIRVVIPSCIVQKIRHQYPNINGIYTGFNPP